MGRRRSKHQKKPGNRQKPGKQHKKTKNRNDLTANSPRDSDPKVLSIPEQGRPLHDDAPTEIENGQPETEKPPHVVTGDKPKGIVFWTGLGAVATAIGVVLLIIELTCVRQSLELNEKAYKAAYRARLSVTKYEISVPFPEKPIMVTLAMQNTGDSVAENFSAGIRGDLATCGIDMTRQELVGLDREGTGAISRIAKGMDLQKVNQALNPLTKEQFDAVMSGQQCYYIRAVFRYSDVFCSERLLNYCAVYVPPNDDLTACRGGNEERPCQDDTEQ